MQGQLEDHSKVIQRVLDRFDFHVRLDFACGLSRVSLSVFSIPREQFSRGRAKPRHIWLVFI